VDYLDSPTSADDVFAPQSFSFNSPTTGLSATPPTSNSTIGNADVSGIDFPTLNQVDTIPALDISLGGKQEVDTSGTDWGALNQANPMQTPDVSLDNARVKDAKVVKDNSDLHDEEGLRDPNIATVNTDGRGNIINPGATANVGDKNSDQRLQNLMGASTLLSAGVDAASMARMSGAGFAAAKEGIKGGKLAGIAGAAGFGLKGLSEGLAGYAGMKTSAETARYQARQDARKREEIEADKYTNPGGLLLGEAGGLFPDQTMRDGALDFYGEKGGALDYYAEEGMLIEGDPEKSALMLAALKTRGALGDTLSYSGEDVNVTQGRFKNYDSRNIVPRFNKGVPSSVLLEGSNYELDSVVQVPGVDNMSIGYVGNKPFVIPSSSDKLSKADALEFNQTYAGHKQKGKTVHTRYHKKDGGTIGALDFYHEGGEAGHIHEEMQPMETLQPNIDDIAREMRFSTSRKFQGDVELGKRINQFKDEISLDFVKNPRASAQNQQHIQRTFNTEAEKQAFKEKVLVDDTARSKAMDSNIDNINELQYVDRKGNEVGFGEDGKKKARSSNLALRRAYDREFGNADKDLSFLDYNAKGIFKKEAGGTIDAYAEGGMIVGQAITFKDASGKIVSGTIKDIKDGEITLN